MKFSLRDRLVGPGDTLGGVIRRALRVGIRTGMIGQITVGGLARLARLSLDQPLGPGIVHALYAESFGDRDYIVARADRITYAGFEERLNRFVHTMRGLGLGRASKLVLMSPNSWQYVLAFFGAIRGGFSAVHASYRLTPAELEYIVSHAGARALIFAPSCWPAVKQVQQKLAAEEIHWIATGPLPEPAPAVLQLEELMAVQPSDFPMGKLRETGAENVVYTSGTTGKPKGAVRRMSDMGLAEALAILERLDYKSGERHLVVCPLYHSGAQALASIHTGGGSTLVLLEKFDPLETLKTLHDAEIDSVFLVPTMIQRILDLPDEQKHRYQPSLRCLISGAAPFTHPLRLRAIDYFGPVVYDFYGSTENGWLTLVDAHEMRERPHTVGRAIAGAEIFILDEQGRSLPPGEVGRITALSHMVIEGYHADERATRESRVGETQLSGDLGHLDPDGYLYLSGRTSDMIITGGVNTYPAEIEQVLIAHPRVQEVAVLGLPDETWGEVVAAFVVGPGPDDVAELKDFCKRQLAGFKIPRAWHFLEELPRNPTGKVLKRQLREQYAG